MVKLDDFIRSVEKILLVILISVMLILGLMQIISRFVLKSPIPWSEAMLTYMFIWASFLGASLAVSEKAHFGVEIFVDRLTPNFKRSIEVFVNVLLVVFSLFLISKGMIFVMTNRNQLMPAMPFTMSWPYLALPVSGLFIAIHALNHIYSLFIGRE